MLRRYSPKVTKLIDVLRACDADDAEHNPEDRKADRQRKHLIFCEDIHDIRAVAGALMAHGWTFGMELAADAAAGTRQARPTATGA